MMNRQERRRLHKLPVEKVTISLDKVIYHRPRRGFVDGKNREGVFVHSFKCNECGLHFNIYSWFAERHLSTNVWCPECGQRGGLFRHYRKQISEFAGAGPPLSSTVLLRI